MHQSSSLLLAPLIFTTGDPVEFPPTSIEEETTLKEKYMKSDNILAPTAIEVLLSGLYRYGIAVTTILVLVYCGFGPGKIQCTNSYRNVLPWDYLWT